MDAMVALDMAVKTKLEDTFGKGIAMLIVANAFNAASTPIVGLDKGNYLQLIQAICCDTRVKNMWGDAGARAQQEEWAKLVD